MDRATIEFCNFQSIPAVDGVRVSVDIREGGETTGNLWFKVSGALTALEIGTGNVFVAPALLYALKKGQDIRFDVPVSERLAINVYDLTFIFSVILGYNRRPRVTLSDVVGLQRTATGGVTGFSSGVDSWFTLKQALLDIPDNSKRVRHLIVNDVGANGTDAKKESVLNRARQVADQFGLGLVHVQSNLHDFIRLGFQATHTARNGSVAHLLTGLADQFYYSSSYTYVDAGVFKSDGMGYADTIILPLMSSEAITLASSASAFTRAEKTREIAGITGIKGRLDVCVNHGHGGEKINCGSCWKCLRTEITLEAFGSLRDFEDVFHLEAYHANRDNFLKGISLSRNPTDAEVFDLACSSGIIRSRSLFQLHGLARKGKSFIRRMPKALSRRLAR